MIANVAMMAMEGATDLDHRIRILVNVTCTIHKECQTYDPLKEPERLRSGICTIIALLHIFLEKYGVEPLMTVLQKAQAYSRRDAQDRPHDTESLDRRRLYCYRGHRNAKTNTATDFLKYSYYLLLR